MTASIPKLQISFYSALQLQQHLFHQPQAQRKSNIQPDRMGNNSGRKTMTFVTDRSLDHCSRLSAKGFSYR